MDKPFSIILNETKTKIADALNESGLHPAIMEMIVKDILTEITVISQKTAISEKQKYEEASTEE